MSTLTEYLTNTGETQSAFAARLGVTQGTISKLCSGKSPSMRLAALIKIATGGAVSADDWLQGIDSDDVSDLADMNGRNIPQGHDVAGVKAASGSVA